MALALAAMTVAGSSPATINSRTKLSTPARLVPEPPPLVVQDVLPRDAIAINAHIPFSSQPIIAAIPFHFSGDQDSRRYALQCLGLAIYYEAGNQDEASQQAVAQVVLNRVRHPAFPSSICDVVFQNDKGKSTCQFTFTCDGSLLRRPDPVIWSRAERIADAALNGAVFAPVGLALNYHANYVVPYWATTLVKNAQVGVHIFYGWPAEWGMPQAFVRRYLGKEPEPAQLEASAMLRAGAWTKGLISAADTINFVVDPRLELLSVAQQLAHTDAPSHPPDRQYARDIADYFSSYKDDPAVQLFAKLSESDPQFVSKAAALLMSKPLHLDSAPTQASDQPDGTAADGEDLNGFVDALTSFARSSKFERFFADHKRFYRDAAETAQERAGMVRAYWQAYTRTGLPPRSLVVATLRAAPAPTCTDGAANSPAVFLPLSAISDDSDADLFLDAESRVQSVEAMRAPHHNIADALPDEQLVGAVFDRIAALTHTDELSRKHAEAHADLPVGTGRIFNRELRFYEAHQNDFPTWREFTHRFPAARLSLARNEPAGPQASWCKTLSQET